MPLFYSMNSHTTYKQVLYTLLLEIPKGRVTTYKSLAICLGSPHLARYVGTLLGQNEDLSRYPCYRVICSNGSIGGYRLGVEEKRIRLSNDGITIHNSTIDLSRYGFSSFSSISL
ncbi:MGMT family protein [Chitinivibrio alkaliphilus]|uniref:O6-methylguanine-DNA methyltransferase/endonuclease V n=1 Tax=Chitinivibrio alkaliphilus ACht1 TaxID=1313304 RepID=U7D947_9BACT|nr:MGMT family protein [Chitinivibrio alkaliphilus]ERP30920.1 O6-methylguanine-DNA methyltransferase/endonuclease V [Chitinivibrio alkaliphilus ACht1]